MRTIKPRLRTLKNGVRVAWVENPASTACAINIFFRVGSRHETPEIMGVSHFIEHLMFKGTKKRKTAQDVSRDLDRFGADYNASTSKDHTSYYIKIEADQALFAIDVLHDMLANSTFKKEDIDRERGVIVEEINMYEDNPQSQMMDLLDEMTFGPTHPLGWNIAGTREIIRTVPRDTLLDYRSRFYNPEHMCVAIAGRIPKGAWALLESTFGSWKTVKKPVSPKQTDAFSPTTVKGVRLSFQQKKIEQVQLGMSFLTYPILDPRHDAARLLAVILGGTMSSRLFTEVREKRGLCYHISASRSSFEDIGTFRIVAGLEKTRLQEAVEVIWKELDSVAKKGVSAQELTRAKDFHRGKFYLEFEDPFVQADWYGDQLRYREDWVSPEERMKRIQAVTPKQIQAVAKEIFNRKNYAVSVVGPFASAKDIEKWF